MLSDFTIKAVTKTINEVPAIRKLSPVVKNLAIKYSNNEQFRNQVLNVALLAARAKFVDVTTGERQRNRDRQIKEIFKKAINHS